MLVRAARRNVHSNTISSVQSSRRLLPFTRVAPLACAPERGRLLTVDGAPLSRRARTNSKDPSTAQNSRRSLATAVTYPSFDDIPFEGISSTSQHASPGYGDINSLLDLKGFGPNSIIRLKDPLTSSVLRHRRHSKTGLGGDIDEMRSVFEVCMHVGRFERASMVLERVRYLEPDSAMILPMHNLYLRYTAEKVMLNPSTNATQAIHTWFETNMVQNGVVPDAESISYMVKVSLKAQQDRRHRLVTRYMDMISQDTVYQVLCLDILSAQEINEVVQICPEYKFAEEMPELIEEVSISKDSTPIPEFATVDTYRNNEQLRRTEQKGLGMKSLRQSLSLFSNLAAEEINSASREEKRQIQKQLEQDAVESAIDRWREESVNLRKFGLDTALQTKSLGARMWRWQTDLTKCIKEEIEKVDAAEAIKSSHLRTPLESERVIYGPFLRVLPPEKIAAVTILHVMTLMGSGGLDTGLKLANLISTLANSVEEESAAEVLQQTSKRGVWPADSRSSMKRKMSPEALKKLAKSRHGALSKAVADMNAVLDEDVGRPKDWNLLTNAKFGGYLLSALIDTAQIPVSVELPDTKETLTQLQPAFIHSYMTRMGKKTGMVHCNKALIAQLRREPVHSLLAKHLPMLVEPEPWSEFNKGGFLVHPAKVMRIKLGDKDQRYYAEAAVGLGNMDLTFKGLDVLGKTGWRINQPVYDVMLEAWNSGEAIANLPAENPIFDIPREPDCADDPLERREWIKNVKQMENKKIGLHSVRCFQNFQLEIARSLQDVTFYFPHNIDFRGRAYPIPPYLNHMGVDHCRGLMKFSKSRELGEGGLRWLKIQFANVFGFDKASLSEREEFANKHMDDIYDSAVNGLHGKRFWLKAEDPWQCLAACIEIRNAIESGNPATYESQLPVHQDGTCNGLQHYAALGGDSWGAQQVNLEPGDRPADIYSAVADLVRAEVVLDATQGHEYAKYLEDKITRKTVKQPVMTNVYGVTFIGAKAQVRKQLLAAHPDIPKTTTFNAELLAGYIATKIFTAMSNMFKGAHDIQYWLAECASRITMSLNVDQLDRIELETFAAGDAHRSSKPIDLDQLIQHKSSVIWTTPLQTPVVQPYRQSKSRTVTTRLRNIHLSEPHRSNPVEKRKQMQAFPPNFVHSLDATHMLLSALTSDKRGLTFAAVHDSFWTHASDIDSMNEVLRDAFIRIHSEDVIGRLKTEFEARYKGSYYQFRVYGSSSVYQKITKWRRDNKPKSSPWRSEKRRDMRIDELILERRRQKLLSSSNPEEVEEGKAMITPTSIFQEYSTSADFKADSEIQGQGLGDITSEVLSVDARDTIEAVVPEAAEAVEAAATVDSETQHVPNTFERKMDSKREYNRQQNSNIWLPLVFPPVPQKGDFDVSKLKDSKYFFS